jgi:hypothetical protein
MNRSEVDLSCVDCGKSVKTLPTFTSFRGQETYLFHPIICKGCLIKTCKQYSTPCANCGEIVLPYSQVGVLKDNHWRNLVVHMTTSCLTVGSAFHGFWGKGQLLNFMEIEAC